MNKESASACDLFLRHCTSITDATPRLDRDDVTALLAQIPRWREHITPDYGQAIRREFQFRNFDMACAFVHHVVAIAKEEGHHPDILIHTSRHVTLTLTTHAINALSLNDFIFAAKIDRTL